MLTTKLYPGFHVNGPYFIEAKGRWQVNVCKGAITIAMNLSRFKMQEHLGRILEPTEDVDHIDEDKTNDELSNLQVLDKPEHASKSKSVYPKLIAVVCPSCGEEFTMTNVQQAIYQRKKRTGSDGPFCSRRCSTTYYHRHK
jgi:endogenous inhibitor of DNA gyrase (YacG/DUF329 family)